MLFDYQRMEWFLLDVDLYVTGSSNPGKGGYIKGLGNYQRGEFATIEAVPESGYLFVEWRGGLSGTEFGAGRMVSSLVEIKTRGTVFVRVFV